MHPLRELTNRRKGIASFCTANEIVLEAAMEDAISRNTYILMEATANQVNQYGGYTGMQPCDYMSVITKLAEKIGLDSNLLILGGDHLGPIIWQNEPEHSAMKKAEILVSAYVEAGFTKIHLDTSMRLADDPIDRQLSIEIVAARGARLAKSAIKAWEKRRAAHPDAQKPIFVIGSEVPIPGGSQENEEGISVTTPKDFEETVSVYKNTFESEKIEHVWDDVIAVVVQPGVEFSDNQVFLYDKKKAASLVQQLSNYPNLAFEGHSTDYQTPDCLKDMVQDGVLILKVGPELTFALREGLLALTGLECELIPEHRRSYFRSVLDETMRSEPGYWEKYYHGTDDEKKQARIFSFSDRCRYYFAHKDVRQSIDKLCANIDSVDVPVNVLHQYLPSVCDEILVSGKMTTRELLKLYLRNGVINKYQIAVES